MSDEKPQIIDLSTLEGADFCVHIEKGRLMIILKDNSLEDKPGYFFITDEEHILLEIIKNCQTVLACKKKPEDHGL